MPSKKLKKKVAQARPGHRGPKPKTIEQAKKARSDDQRKADFLYALSELAAITGACEASDVPRVTVYNWRERDPDFAKAWDEALEKGIDALEDEMMRRAKQGVEKPVYQGGLKVGTVREYSDTLAIFLAKGRRPERYRERTELSGPGGKPLEVPTLNVNFVSPKGKK